LLSIKEAASKNLKTYVILVAPKNLNPDNYLGLGLIDKFIEDPGFGLAAAINVGMKNMPMSVQYLNWLGDDDSLTHRSLESTAEFLDRDLHADMVFGQCRYIDPRGNEIFVSKVGRVAVSLMRFGPDLIPQPGALFRKSTFEKIGGLNTEYKFAFDFDLFIRISIAGKVKYMPKILSNFRWHPASLSVEYRSRAIREASEIRRTHLPRGLRPLSVIWEPIVAKLTLLAGSQVSKSSLRKKGLR
jgi:hypothetical protein